MESQLKLHVRMITVAILCKECHTTTQEMYSFKNSISVFSFIAAILSFMSGLETCSALRKGLELFFFMQGVDTEPAHNQIIKNFTLAL